MITREAIAGKIIAFEGMDYTFKETNCKTFVNRLRQSLITNSNDIHEVENIWKFVTTESFPRYKSGSSYFVKMWLSGTYDRQFLKSHPGILNDMYALDRFDYWNASVFDNKSLLNIYKDKECCFIFDRYSPSAAFYNPMYTYMSYIDKNSFIYEYEKFKNPNPDIVVLLHPSDFGAYLSHLAQKKDKDESELDTNFLTNVYKNISMVQKTNVMEKVGIKLICIDIFDENLLIKSKKDLEDEIWDKVCKVLEDD